MPGWLSPPASPALRGIIAANLAVFVLIQLTFYSRSDAGGLALLWLTRPGPVNLLLGQFVHVSLWHILFNLIALASFAEAPLARLGERRFLLLYLAGGLAGSVLHYLFHPVAAIGASGAVSAVVCFFAVYLHDRRFRFLLFFVVPVALSGRAMAIGFFALNLLGALSGAGSISFWSHIGGGLAGAGYALLLLRGPRGWRRW